MREGANPPRLLCNTKLLKFLLPPQLKASLYEEFSYHAMKMVGFNGLETDPVVFEIKDSNRSLGICVCQLFWGNLHIKYLITKEEYRNCGIGRTLMEHALDFGKKQGCHFAFVETMSFQAPEFYQKLGFDVELKREGYTLGTSFYYLRKDL